MLPDTTTGRNLHTLVRDGYVDVCSAGVVGDACAAPRQVIHGDRDLPMRRREVEQRSARLAALRFRSGKTSREIHAAITGRHARVLADDERSGSIFYRSARRRR